MPYDSKTTIEMRSKQTDFKKSNKNKTNSESYFSSYLTDQYLPHTWFSDLSFRFSSFTASTLWDKSGKKFQKKCKNSISFSNNHKSLWLASH